MIAKVNGDCFNLEVVFVGSGGGWIEAVVAMEDKGKMIEVKVIKIVNAFGGFGPSGIDGNPGLFLWVIVLWPSMKDIGGGVGWFYLGVVGVGKTFDFTGGNTFGSGQGNKKIGEFGAETEMRILDGEEGSLAMTVIDLLIVIVQV